MSTENSQRVNGGDPRVSGLIKWLWTALGTAFVGGVYWVGTSINDLNTSVVRIIAQNDSMLAQINRNDTRDDRQDEAIVEIRGDVREIQGRTFRGVPGYDQKEPRRGN